MIASKQWTDEWAKWRQWMSYDHMKPPPVKAVQWFARGGGIERMGPYDTQVEAAAVLVTTDGTMVDGAFVWPEVLP